MGRRSDSIPMKHLGALRFDDLPVACLKLANTHGVPDSFELTFELGRTRRPCRVVWRTNDQLAVAFAEKRTGT
jgi:hypothetical protein